MDALKTYDVVIVGGGVTGTSILHLLSNYTNAGRLALIEQYERVATVNSHPRNNSQTLHFGDIETNYELDKALVLKEAAEMLVRYVTRRSEAGLFRKTHKMVLGVGADEVEKLEARYAAFRGSYPNLQRLERVQIVQCEPKVVEGRDPHEPILALLSENGYAINYQMLSEAFLEDSEAASKTVDVFFSTPVKSIVKSAHGGYTIETPEDIFEAKAVVVAAGPYSLLFAQSLGYEEDLGILPVAGSFYFSHKVLSGKVYTLQIPRIPFAAVHGDPDVVTTDETRFGPTAKVLPLLERHKYSTFFDFLKTPLMRLSGFITLVRFLFDRTLSPFLIKNLLYDLPVVGKWLFLRSVRKIIPSMRYRDLKLGKRLGGIRPQIVNTRTRELLMGESKIVGDNIIFNTTPSPGASVCLKNAERDAKTLVEFLGNGFSFDEQQFAQDFKTEQAASG